jgi:hypothetical protein
MRAEKELSDLVFEILRETDGLSIAGMVRALKDRGVEAHRLIVSGYLHALADAGYLEVHIVPPTKMFMLKRSLGRTVYSAIGEAARGMSATEPGAVELAVAALGRVLDRPVFLSEVAAMGFTSMSALRQLGKKERADAVRRLEEGGVRVREGEPLFEAKDRRDAEVGRLLDEVTLSAFSCRAERPRAAVQTALTLDRFK